MFDIGFWELCLVGLVSLLVIGPERLPKAARIAGFWVGKARHTLQRVKTEINQELYAEEVRQMIDDQQENMQTIMDETTHVTATAKKVLTDIKKKSS